MGGDERISPTELFDFLGRHGMNRNDLNKMKARYEENRRNLKNVRQELVNQMDANGDGLISRDEFISILDKPAPDKQAMESIQRSLPQQNKFQGINSPDTKKQLKTVETVLNSVLEELENPRATSPRSGKFLKAPCASEGTCSAGDGNDKASASSSINMSLVFTITGAICFQLSLQLS